MTVTYHNPYNLMRRHGVNVMNISTILKKNTGQSENVTYVTLFPTLTSRTPK